MRRFMLFLFILACAVPVAAQSEKAFLGKWGITGVAPNNNVVYWLEVKNENGQIKGWFLNRGGSVYELKEIKLENGELVFDATTRPNTPKQVHRAKVVDGKLVGSIKTERGAINWVGVRPPKWGKYDANAKHKFGQPVELFSGKSLDAWDVQHKNRPSGWSIEDGVMTNEARANNLISKEKFKDFKIEAEYKLADKSNSGIYLRGRYELQVLGDYGKEAESHGHMAIYSRVAPTVNASKPPGEWQKMEAIIVGNRVSVWLNGQKIHDNVELAGITGGALDANEGAPGPIMIQGDHEKVHYRKIVVTPIIK